MLNLVWLNFALQTKLLCVKKQPFGVVFYFIVKGVGAWITLCFATLKESASTRRGKAEAKELPTPSPPHDAFLRRGNLLPSRNERSGLKQSDGSQRSEAKVKGGDIALLTQSVANMIQIWRFQGAGLGESNLQIWNLIIRNQGEVSRDDFKCFEVNFVPRLDM